MLTPSTSLPNFPQRKLDSSASSLPFFNSISNEVRNMVTVKLLLLVFALVLFIVAACGVTSGRINLVAAGLACFIASMLFG